MCVNGRSYKETTATPSTSDAQILPLNVDRKALIIWNTGTVAVFIGIGTSTVKIAVDDYRAFTNSDAPINALNAKSASGAGAITIWEA